MCIFSDFDKIKQLPMVKLKKYLEGIYVDKSCVKLNYRHDKN